MKLKTILLVAAFVLSGCMATVPPTSEKESFDTNEIAVFKTTTDLLSTDQLTQNKNVVNNLNFEREKLQDLESLLTYFGIGEEAYSRISYEGSTKIAVRVVQTFSHENNSFRFTYSACRGSNSNDRDCSTVKAKLTGPEGSSGRLRESIVTGDFRYNDENKSLVVTLTPKLIEKLFTVNPFNNELQDYNRHDVSSSSFAGMFGKKRWFETSYQSEYNPEATATQLKRNFEDLKMSFNNYIEKKRGESASIYDRRADLEAYGMYKGRYIKVEMEIEPYKNGSLVTYKIEYPIEGRKEGNIINYDLTEELKTVVDFADKIGTF